MPEPMNPSQTSEKKIYVDEDWKSQVEREKAEADRKSQEHAKETPKEPAPAEKLAVSGAEAADMPMPPATFSYLTTSLYYQAMMSFGMMPHPVTKKAELHLPQAKHAIDMLAMLEQKTEGNRTADESAELEEMLHHLRLTYVQLNK